MSTVWMEPPPVLLDLSKPRPRSSWGGVDEYAEPPTPNPTQNFQVLVLHFRREDRGATYSCPEIELAMCGATEGEAWQRFLEAYNDLRSFLEDNEGALSPELKQRLATLRKETGFQFVERP